MNLKHLYTRLQSMYFIGLLLPLIIALCIFTGIYSLRMLNVDNRLNENILNSIAYNIEIKMNSMSRCSNIWSNQEAMEDFFVAVEKNGGEIPTKPVNLAIEYKSACINIMYLFSEVNPIGIGFYPLSNPNDNYFLFTYSDGLNNISNSNIENCSWFDDVIDSRGSAVFTPIVFDDAYSNEDEGVFSIVRLVTDIETRKALGIIKIDVSAKYFSKLFSNADNGGTSFYVLSNRDGDVIYSTEKWETSLNLLPGKYSIYSQNVGNTDWKLQFYMSAVDRGNILRSVLFLTLVITVLTVFISFIGYRYTSRQITEPLNCILETMKCASKGNYNKKISFNGECKVHEFTLIMNQYNKMIDKFGEYIEREYIAVSNQQLAEFRALQMQINPHFLYNILNCFVALNRMGAKNRLEKAIIALTNMFHYTCSLDYTKTLEEEFAFTEEYLELQQIRYQDKLQWKIALDDECRKYTIPKLIIQPLVENSIIHGVEPVDRMVSISVLGEYLDGFIMIRVSDDGAGISAEGNMLSNGIGLDNIKKRIKCLSASAELNVSINDSGAECIMLLPVTALTKRGDEK